MKSEMLNEMIESERQRRNLRRCQIELTAPLKWRFTGRICDVKRCRFRGFETAIWPLFAGRMGVVFSGLLILIRRLTVGGRRGHFSRVKTHQNHLQSANKNQLQILKC